MTTHELARKLLEGPDLPVMIGLLEPEEDFYGYEDVSNINLMHLDPEGLMYEEKRADRSPVITLT